MITTFFLAWILVPFAILIAVGVCARRTSGVTEGHLTREDRLISECLAKRHTRDKNDDRGPVAEQISGSPSVAKAGQGTIQAPVAEKVLV